MLIVWVHEWHTANIYSQFTVIGCVTCATVIWQWLLHLMTVHMTFNDTEEYSLRSIAILGCNIYSQIAVAHVTLLKAVLSTVKIFAVYEFVNISFQTFCFNWPLSLPCLLCFLVRKTHLVCQKLLWNAPFSPLQYSIPLVKIRQYKSTKVSFWQEIYPNPF